MQQAKRVEITWVEIAGDRAKVGTDAASEPFLLIKTEDRWYIDPAGESSAEIADKGTSDAIADRKIATASMLKVEDFPKGWSAEPRDRTDDAMCTITEATERTGAQSPWLGFNRGERESLSHRVYVFPDEAVADSAFAVFSEIRSLTCAADEFKATRAKEQGVEVVDVETLSEPGPAIGDASAANHMTMVLRQDGQTTRLKMHLLLVRQARGIGVILLQSQRPVDPALRDRLLRAISKRLATHTA